MKVFYLPKKRIAQKILLISVKKYGKNTSETPFSLISKFQYCTLIIAHTHIHYGNDHRLKDKPQNRAIIHTLVTHASHANDHRLHLFHTMCML